MIDRRAFLLWALFLLPAWSHAQAQPNPLAPDAFRVRLRYRIDAFGNERIVQFQDMVKRLQSLGMEIDEYPETQVVDPAVDRLTGTVAAKDARGLLTERHVRSLLLVPRGAKEFDRPDAPVRVQLELVGGLPPERQRLLAEQTVSVLGTLDFKEGVGYDNRAHTRLLGSIPVDRLEVLLNDLRRTPAGAKLADPFQNVSPVRIIEAMPGVPLPVPMPKFPEPPKGQENLDPALRVLLANAAEAAKPQRLQVILAQEPLPLDPRWQQDLSAAVPGVVIEGRFGQVVTVVMRPDRAAALANLPLVAAVRLSRRATAPGGDDALVLADSLGQKQALGRRGHGAKVAIIDADFRGLEAALAGKQLPATTRSLDLTTERNRDLRPDPYAGDAAVMGHGTRCAIAVALAAPDVELTLVRVDPSEPYQLLQAAQYINGDAVRSFTLAQRRAEIDLARSDLAARRQQLLEERRRILDDYSQDDETKARREDYFKRQEQHDRDEKAFDELARRYLDIQQGYRRLHEVGVVASALVWNDGYPVDGAGALTRYLDDRPGRRAIWFQSRGETTGQAWTGMFRDANGNGVMEFVPETSSPWWRRELNFLAWQPADGRPLLDLPAGARLRFTVQWQEPHDAELLREGEDFYLRPIVSPRLVLLRQLDPTGTRQPADDLEVVGASVGPALRLRNLPNAATYEQTVEFTVPAVGRYALRAEGTPPVDIRPASVPTLPAVRRMWEWRPRLFVTTLGGTGRAIFSDYAAAEETNGMPADARLVILAGGAGLASRR